MIAFGFIEECESTGPGCKGYVYKLTEDGEKEAVVVAGECKREFSSIKQVIRVCNGQGGLSPIEIVNASKVRYMRYEFPGKAGRSHATAHAAKELGWKMSAGSIKQGAGLLEKLRLAR